jgi:hypothetical protein
MLAIITLPEQNSPAHNFIKSTGVKQLYNNLSKINKIQRIIFYENLHHSNIIHDCLRISCDLDLPSNEGVLFAFPDCPFVSSDTIEQALQKFESDKNIVISLAKANPHPITMVCSTRFLLAIRIQNNNLQEVKVSPECKYHLTTTKEYALLDCQWFEYHPYILKVIKTSKDAKIQGGLIGYCDNTYTTIFKENIQADAQLSPYNFKLRLNSSHDYTTYLVMVVQYCSTDKAETTFWLSAPKLWQHHYYQSVPYLYSSKKVICFRQDHPAVLVEKRAFLVANPEMLKQNDHDNFSYVLLNYPENIEVKDLKSLAEAKIVLKKL